MSSLNQRRGDRLSFVLRMIAGIGALLFASHVFGQALSLDGEGERHVVDLPSLPAPTPTGTAPLRPLPLAPPLTPPLAAGTGTPRHGCPSEMVRVANFCIDRFEIRTLDKQTGQPLSPYYPPNRWQMRRAFNLWQIQAPLSGAMSARGMPLPDLSEWQRVHDFSPKARSEKGVVPQGYMTYYAAEEACKNANKRLCQKEEWTLACQGEKATRFPYGAKFERSKCNVYRYYHPSYFLHGATAIGHTDPRLNLVVERGVTPVLALTGSHLECASQFGDDSVYDMVGNLDEWVQEGAFMGGFYARGTTKGCEAEVNSHALRYYDYSTGTRCCSGPRGLSGASSR